MLRISPFWLAIVFSLLVFNIGLFHALKQHPPYAPPVNSEQQAHGALKGEDHAKAGEQEAAKSNEEQGGKKPEQRDEDGTEFWPTILGVRLKITDLLLAVFTGGLLIFTGLLWRSTDKLWASGDRSAIMQREIGEAQVRAYVSIKEARIRFDTDEYAHPVVTFLPTNSGQSPARNFIWNIDLQYVGDVVNRSVTFNRKWLEDTGTDIASAADATQTESAHIPGMSVKLLIEDAHPERDFNLVRIKIDFRYTDIFGRDWFDEAYFAGLMTKNPHRAQRNANGEAVYWIGSGLLRVPKPSDWDSIPKIPTA